MKIVCVGMMVCDIPLAPIPKNIFKLDKCEIKPPKPTTGGDALNVSIALAKLGIDTSLAGRVGKDYNGEFIKACARQYGVDISGVIEDDEELTATSYVLIDTDKERHFISHNDIFHKLTESDVSDVMLKEAGFVYFGSAMVMKQMDMGGTGRLFKRAHANHAVTVMDTALNPEYQETDQLRQSPLYIELEKTLHETDIFLPSYEEARLITGQTDPRAMRRDLEKYHFKTLVIKLGSQGCYVTDFKEEQFISGFKHIKVEDTTGAGDSFAAGFLCGCSKNWDILECAVFANSIAAQNVTTVGATNGVPDFNTGMIFLQEHKDEIRRSDSPFE